MIPGTFTVDPESGEVTYEGQPTDSSDAAPATPAASSRLRST